MPIESAKLKAILHDKIERMDILHLWLLYRFLLKLEAEELAKRLAKALTRTMKPAS